MKIVLVHHSAPPVVGGVERVLGQHARLLADAGHRVEIVAARGRSGDRRVRLRRVPLVDSLHPDIVRLNGALAAGRVPPTFGRLRDRIVDELRPLLADTDVVIAHNVASLNKNLALTAALQQLSAADGAPRLVLWHHDLAWCLDAYRPSLHEGQPWDLLRTAWPGATQVAISVVRQQELASLTGLPQDAIRVIPNGVDVATMLQLDPRTRTLLGRGGIGEALPLLLMPARIVPRKNVELGIRTVAALVTAGWSAGLLVTGPVDPHDPEQQGYLAMLRGLAAELAVADRVWFPGTRSGSGLADPVVADLYALADCLFLPSREEGFGIPILEALLRRLPIVCADLPVLHEVAGDAATYVAPDADPAMVAQRVVATLTGDPLRAASMRVRRDASWEAVGRRWLLPLLDELAGTARG